MNYETQIKQALARGYCTPENACKIVDPVLMEAMTIEVLKSVGFIPAAEGVESVSNTVLCEPSSQVVQNADDLLTCPFCGGHGEVVGQSTIPCDNSRIYVHCNSCGADGGWAKTRGNAVKQWQMRI